MTATSTTVLNEKQQNYIDRIEWFSRARATSVLIICDVIEAIVKDMEAAEDTLSDACEGFSQPGRVRGKKRLYCDWSIGQTSKHAYGPDGPYFMEYRLASPRGEQNLIRRDAPTRQELRFRYKEEYVPYQQTALKQIKEVTKAYKQLREYLVGAVMATSRAKLSNGQRVYEKPSPPQRTAFRMNDVRKYRRIILESVQEAIEELGYELDSIDTQLNVLVEKFNRIMPRHRSGTIIASWDVWGEQKAKVVGPNGPTFYTINYFSGNRRKMIVRTGTHNTNRLTKSLLKERRLGRYERPYINLGEQIFKLRLNREKIQEQLLTIWKLLKPYIKDNYHVSYD